MGVVTKTIDNKGFSESFNKENLAKLDFLLQIPSPNIRVVELEKFF